MNILDRLLALIGLQRKAAKPDLEEVGRQATVQLMQSASNLYDAYAALTTELIDREVAKINGLLDQLRHGATFTDEQRENILRELEETGKRTGLDVSAAVTLLKNKQPLP